MGALFDGALNKKFWQYLTLKKQKQNILKKGGTKIKITKFLIVGIREIINLILNFCRTPKKPPSVPNVCKLDKLLSEILQISEKNNDAFCITIMFY